MTRNRSISNRELAAQGVYMQKIESMSTDYLLIYQKETYKGDDILQKRPIIWSSLLAVATPYLRHTIFCIYDWNRKLTAQGVYMQKIESMSTHYLLIYHIWMSHVPHMNESCHTYEWVMSHIWMSPVPYMNETCLSDIFWYIKKRPIIWSSLLAIATPYLRHTIFCIYDTLSFDPIRPQKSKDSVS